MAGPWPVPDLYHTYTVYNNGAPSWVDVDQNRFGTWWANNWRPHGPFYDKKEWTEDHESRYDTLYVPFEYSHLVCLCPTEVRNLRPVTRHPDNGDGSDKHIKCTVCDKWAKYLLLKCSSCGERFFNVFRHPYQCFYKQVCWDCVSKRTEPPCTHGEIGDPMPGLQLLSCKWIRDHRDAEPVPPPFIDMTERSREFNLAMPDF